MWVRQRGPNRRGAAAGRFGASRDVKSLYITHYRCAAAAWYYHSSDIASYILSAMVTSPFENYLDLVEAARLLGIHPQSLRRLIKQKKVPAVLFAGKYLIERDKLEMFKSNYDPRPGRKPIRRLL